MGMELRPYQREAKAAVLEQWEQGVRATLLVLPTGCHDPNQILLMADGSLQQAWSISIGSRLMGPDGTARTVMRVHSGVTGLKRIVPVKGEPFVVTHDHVLTLVRTNEKPHGRYPSAKRGGEVLDVSVADWAAWSKTQKHIHKLFRVSCDFGNRDDSACVLDPYTLGVLLGDGSFRTNLSVTTQDEAVRLAVCDGLRPFGLRLIAADSNCGKATCWLIKAKAKGQHDCIRFRRNVLRPMGLDQTKSGTKYIPAQYRTASRSTRLALLAGLMDTDGSATCGGFDYVSKSELLANDVAFVARSLGLAAYVKPSQKNCQNGNGGTYWRVSISGDTDMVPCRVQHKRQLARRQKKSVLRTGFRVEDAGLGPYAGFSVDGDGRYLLGDFTVTHNCGKTIVFSSIIEHAVRAGGRCLVLAHREELLQQAADKLARTTGLGCGVEKAEQSALDSWFNVVVGSVQTMQREHRRNGHEFTHIIVDEAHHAISPSYRAVIDHYPDAKLLGVTATADRGDKRDLGEVFETLAYEYSLPRAVRDGWLCRIQALTIPLRIDMDGVKVTAGDFSAGDVGSALDPYLEQIAGHVAEQCASRKTVVFLPLIATSQKFLAMLQARGIPSREVNGESQDRADTLGWFRAAGPGSVLCNAMLLTEGYDQSDIDCICVLRPTKVRSLYAQMCGRGTRIHPGKENLLLLDFLWHSERHELCRPAHLICEDPAISRRVAELLAADAVAGPVDIMEADAKAEGTATEEREESLRKLLEEQKRRKRALVDPLQYEYSVGQTEYLPASDDLRAMGPPSTAQLKRLEDAGIFPDEVQCQGHATKLLDTLAKRRTEGLTTPKQIRCLERFGFQAVGTWPFAEAKRMIDRVAGNMWQVPRGVVPREYRPAAPQPVEMTW